MAKMLNLFKRLTAKTLYYPGCMLKNVMTEEQENYKKIFNKLGVDFMMLPSNEVCCGSPVVNAGYKKDAKNLAKRNYEVFKKYNIRKIITPCPGCYNMFLNRYPKLIREWDIEVKHASQEILEVLKRRKRIGYTSREIVSYHDPCHLGRFCGIYDEPREIIRILGGDLREMAHNRKDALCCGAGGGLRANYPEMAKKIAKKRMDEKPVDAKFTITPCGLCTANLKTADDSVVEFSSWVLKRLL